MQHVPNAQPFAVAGPSREFRIEADVGSACRIEELEIGKERSVREDVLDEKRLAPSRVGDDHIEGDASRDEASHDIGHDLSSPNLGLEAGQPRMHPSLAGRRSRFDVWRDVQSRVNCLRAQCARFRCDDPDLIGRIRAQRLDEMPELSRAVSMNEENSHVQIVAAPKIAEFLSSESGTQACQVSNAGAPGR